MVSAVSVRKQQVARELVRAKRETSLVSYSIVNSGNGKKEFAGL